MGTLYILFLGKQRARLGGCDNPDLGQYISSEKKIQSAKDQQILIMQGNTSARNKRKEKPKIDVHDLTPVYKRPKREKPSKNDNDNDDPFGCQKKQFT